MSHHFVDFKNVAFRYPDGTDALKNVTFRITHGEAVGIVGSNGAGKSTILMHMNGHILPTSGAVTVGDLKIDKYTRQEIRRKVGIIFQNPDDQLFMPTVFDDVAFGPLNLGLSHDAVVERVAVALSKVNCLHLRDKPPHHLSGGQKSAVAIASVLAMEPDILVMDEPAASLDPKSRRNLINLLKSFAHSKIIASHDLDLILDVCERCIVIGNGMVVADGPAEEILSNRKLLEENNLELPLSFQRRSLINPETGGAMHDHHKHPHHHHPQEQSASMEDLNKLLVMLNHWVEHDESHAESYREWAEKATNAGEEEIAKEIHLAISDGEAARNHLKRAKSVLAAKMMLRK
jgi:cobalt/nickel transport system ATP-binding protein